MSSIEIAIARLPHGEGLPLPSYASVGAAGLDLRAATAEDEVVWLKPLERQAIGTGLAIALPSGFEAQVRPRSGLAVEHGVTCLNSPGTIDSDYRGEIKVILINFGTVNFAVKRGDRIAQLVVTPVTQARLVEVGGLDETARGTQGFGSSGRR